MSESIRMAELASQYAELVLPMEAAFRRCLQGSRFILGKEVERFELRIAEYLRVPHAIGVSSGTDALLVALTALGVGSGDEVVTTPLTFFASVEAIARLGAKVVLVDVEPSTLQIDVERAAAAIGPRTRAVLPVHLYGSAARADSLDELAQKTGVPLVEDAAQAFGTTCGGRHAGTWGALGCFSFFPAKVLGALGDGGLIATSDDALAARCRRLRQHGSSTRDVHVELGGNFRLDAVQAAVLDVALSRVPAWIARRREHAAAYDVAFASLDDVVPVVRGAGYNGAIYTLRVRDGRRDELRRYLGARGIETAVYYPRLVHTQPALDGRCALHGPVTEAERACDEVLSLPVHPALRGEQRDAVVDAVASFFR